MKVSVVIATYNRSDLLVDLVESVRRQTVRSEIVVADDGSRNRVVCGDRYLWRQDEGYHKVWMVNRAVQMASGDVLAFLDDDTRLRSNRWLETHLKALQQAPVSRGPFYLGRVESNGAFRQFSSYVFGIPGMFWSCTNTMMTREVWDTLGGFDERFDGHYGFEDVDLGLRIKEAKIRVARALPATTAEHVGGIFCSEGNDINNVKMERNRVILEKKWGDCVSSLMKRSG